MNGEPMTPQTPDEKGPTGDYRDDYEQYRPDRQASVTSNPSNDLAADLRYHAKHVTQGGHTMETAANEIERLTRELKRERALEEDISQFRVDGGEKLLAERDRLRARCAELERFNVGLATESERRRAALEPFAKLHEARTTIYQKRGGNPDSFPDSHPAYDITASQLRLGIWRRAAEAYFGGSSDETAAKPVPCWCPYCGEPHGVRRAETDPRGTECQHDRFKPKFTLQWVGSTPDIRANTHRFQCRICRETFDLAIGEAQLGSAEKARGEPASGSGCPACGVMYVPGARHFSGCPTHPGEAV